MRRLLLLAFCSFPFLAQAQNRNVYAGVDSAKGIRWEVDLITTFDDSVQSWARYVRREYYLRTSNRVLLVCGTETIEIGPPVPESCLRKVKTDSLMRFFAAVPKIEGEPPPPIPPRPDSIIVVDQEALKRYWLEHPELRTDTLRFGNLKLLRQASRHDLQLKRTCAYKYGLKHGKERVYYNTTELNQHTLYPDPGYGPFRLKYKGRWKKGKEHGRWKYYTSRNILLETRIYWKGKIIHSRRTHRGRSDAWKEFWRTRPQDSP